MSYTESWLNFLWHIGVSEEEGDRFANVVERYYRLCDLKKTADYEVYAELAYQCGELIQELEVEFADLGHDLAVKDGDLYVARGGEWHKAPNSVFRRRV